MPDRLSALDASFLHLEEPTTPMHVGGVAIFTTPRAGFDFDELATHIARRIALVPRYRQRILGVPGNLANPVWVDDPQFELGYHLRRSALPKPGSERQLLDLVARLMGRPLDRRRPLWEMYVVEGLAGARRGSGRRIAVISKTHHAMVDGIGAIDLGQVILDPTPVVPAPPAPARWHPSPAPTPIELTADAVAEIAHRPSAAVEAARVALIDVRATLERVTGLAAGLLAAARVAARPAPETPLNVDIGVGRRYAVARTRLEDYREIRSALGGTVNDAVLATVAGALRSFLMSRGEPVTDQTSIRALVPVSVRAAASSGDGRSAGSAARSSSTDRALGNRILCYFVDLPVGEPHPVVRHARISYAMRAHKEAGQQVGAAALIRLGGFAPPTLHAVGARAANSFSRRIFNVVVTNVPGPQLPLYAAGARMREVFPVVPLAKGQALSIGLTSYDGGVYYGFFADRDAMPDLDTIPGMIEESLAELLRSSRVG